LKVSDKVWGNGKSGETEESVKRPRDEAGERDAARKRQVKRSELRSGERGTDRSKRERVTQREQQ